MKKKERLDSLLVEKGLFASREQAKRSIMAGLVTVAGERVDKPGMQVATDLAIEIKAELHPYVSRGGLKLERAIKVFNLDFTDATVLDIGASTGGFTDCALQNGAREVYALDVGYGQLAWKLRQDSRVHVMERTNFRYVQSSDFVSGKPNIVTIDVSFISLKIILNHLLLILPERSEVIALVKPQFEAGRELVGKKGIVKEPSTHTTVLNDIVEFAIRSGYSIGGIDYSPIRGGEGNIEFLLYLKHDITAKNDVIHNTESLIKQVVERAHNDI